MRLGNLIITYKYSNCKNYNGVRYTKPRVLTTIRKNRCMLFYSLHFLQLLSKPAY